MAFLFREDSDYDESRRMTGFNRYRQLLSFYAGHWTKLNLICFFSLLPLILGITYSILSSSLLMLIPLSVIGGIICGPFISALMDSIHRGLRDAPGRLWENFKKGLRQNVSCSLLPGGILGFVIGIYSFFFYMLSLESALPSTGTVCLIIFSLAVVLTVFHLYWSQLVLFELGFMSRLRNILLFSAKYLWRIMLVDALTIIFYGIIFIFAPYTLIVLPFIGIWYPMFLGQLIIYDCLNLELHIEEAHQSLEEDEEC